MICKYCLALDISFYKLKGLQWRKNSNMRKDPHAHTTDPQAHTCTHTHTHTCTHTHTHAHTHTYAHTHTHTDTHTCIQPHHTTNHTHSHKHAHTYQHTHACMHIHTHTHVHTHTHSEEDMALTKAKTCACSLSTLLEPLPTHRYRHSQQSSSITSSGTRSSCSTQNTHNIALLLRPHIPPFSTKHMCHCTAASYPRPTVQHKTRNACEKQYWEYHICLLSLLPNTLCTTKAILQACVYRPLNKVTHLNKVMQLLSLDAARSVGDLEEARGVAASILLTKGQCPA